MSFVRILGGGNKNLTICSEYYEVAPLFVMVRLVFLNFSKTIIKPLFFTAECRLNSSTIEFFYGCIKYSFSMFYHTFTSPE